MASFRMNRRWISRVWTSRKTTFFQLLAVDSGAWLSEADGVLEFLRKFADRLPAALLAEHRLLVERLHDSLH